MSIASAFPTLASGGAFSEVLRSAGLGEAEDVARLVGHESRRAVLDEAARLLIKFHPERALVESLPGMVALRDEALSSATFSTRPVNALRRAMKGQIQTWGDLLRLSPNDLLAFANLGEVSAVEIISTAAMRAIVAYHQGSVSSGSIEAYTDSASSGPDDGQIVVPPEAFHSTPIARWPAMRAWSVVAQWLQESSGVMTLLEGIDLLRRSELPIDVASAWDEIESVALDEIATRPPPDFFTTLLDRIDERLGNLRMQTVFWSRILVAPPTLEQLGERLDITRERVRQLQSNAEQLVQGLLLEAEFARVRWRAVALARQLGTAFPTGTTCAEASIAEAAAGVSSDYEDRFRSLLLWLAGPYRQHGDGWTRAKELPRRNLISVALNEGNVIDEAKLLEVRADEGLALFAASAWIAQNVPIRVVGESKYLWEGTVVDKALILLDACREPATAERIVEAIGEDHDIRATRNRLLEDPRFMRVDRQQIGLRDWGMDEYTGIADEIADEIERRGGSCERAELAATVARKCNVRPASVEAYTAAPRFVIDGSSVRLRRKDEPFVSRRTVMDESACYLLSDSVCSYRILVDGEVLRGSGHSIPEGLGIWLGVLPGTQRVVDFGDVDVRITWPDSSAFGPSMGSLRQVAREHGAELGNLIRLTLDRDRGTGTAAVIDLAQLSELSVSDQVALLTGVHPERGELELELGAAVGATARVGLRERLRQRGEMDLLSLIPDRSAELEGALDRLKELL